MSAFRWSWRFAEAGLRVNVHDTNRDVLETLRAGRLPFIEYGGEALLAKALERNRLVFTSAPADISPQRARHHHHRHADRRVPQSRAQGGAGLHRRLLPHLADGQLLVLRSTVFPGTTDWLDGHLKRNNRKLKVAFCPERMVQGHGIKELKETPQIISGTTPEAEEEAAKLFSRIAPELVVVTPREAEFAKLFNNAYRYIEFADRQPVLPDREGGRRRLPAGLRRDEAQLSARARHSLARASPPVRAW